jgi:hypothetical protein
VLATAQKLALRSVGLAGAGAQSWSYPRLCGASLMMESSLAQAGCSPPLPPKD